MDPGFPLADVPTWKLFVETGELARTLTRACVLVESRFALAYRLVSTDGRLALAVTAGEVTRDIPISLVDGIGSTEKQLEGVLHGINELLAEVERPERFALAGDHRTRRRVVVVDMPSLALEDRATRVYDDDASLLGLVAATVVRLGTFAGVAVTCEPRWYQDPGVLTFTVAHDRVSTTLRLRYMPELEVQPILDTLNGMLRGKPHRLYRIARDPDRVDIALIDKLDAVELRRRGELIEHPAREALRTLADAGFELPAMSGPARYATFDVRTAFSRLAVLARGVADIAADVTSDDEALAITWIVDGTRATTRYVFGERTSVNLLGHAIGDLNRMLHGDAGAGHRVVAMTGAPYFYSRRMLVLDRDWLALVADTGDVLPGCLDDAVRAELVRVLGAFPAVAPTSTPARLPRINEVIRNEHIHSSDFKCSARPSDLGDVIEEVARFARVAVEVSPESTEQYTDDGREYVFTVTHRGTQAPVRIADKKYADVTPIVDYLNAILETRAPRRLLYFFRGGGYSSGLVRATDDEVERLRALGYV